MKRQIIFPIKGIMLKLIMLITAVLPYLYSVAQDKKVDIDVNAKSGDSGGGFFTQPWVWIVGGAVFILLLVALVRGNSSKA